MTARLILLLLLVLVAVVIVVVVLRRGAAQRDAHRVEAAHLRSEAETLAANVAGQSAFADQAAERAEVARAEAEERAREAARLEAEAAEHRAALEATQRDYEATMRRADDIDPDVKESQYPAVSESAGERGAVGAAQPDAGTHQRTDVPDGDHRDRADDADHADGDVPMTRAERREAREAGEDAGYAAPAAASSVPAAGAVGGAAVGAAAWAARGDGDRDERGERGDAHSSEESERIASAADFRDDVPAEPTEVYAANDRGSESGMSDNSSTETTQQPGNDDGLDAGGAAAAASAGGGAYAATREMHDDDGADRTDRTDRTDTGDIDRSADGVSHDADADTDRDADHATRAEGEPAEMTIIDEPEAYATTEPVMASEQTPPVSPDPVRTEEEGGTAQREGDADTGNEAAATDDRHDDGSVDHAPAEAGAAVAETDGTHRSAADVAEESPQERYDPTPTRDWAADEGDLLEENSDRGDRLESERADLAHEEGDTTPTTASDGTGSTASDVGGTESSARRISAFEEIRDGGFGVGSAAPLDDGAQPLDHPVKGHHDMTFHAPGDNGYDSAEPDVWFYDEGAAERSGFRRADG